MDPDTSRKVSDLLSLMEDISTDIDVQTDLKALTSELKTIKEALRELAARFDAFEQAYIDKRHQIRAIRDEMLTLVDKDQ